MICQAFVSEKILWIGVAACSTEAGPKVHDKGYLLMIPSCPTKLPIPIVGTVAIWLTLIMLIGATSIVLGTTSDSVLHVVLGFQRQVRSCDVVTQLVAQRQLSVGTRPNGYRSLSLSLSKMLPRYHPLVYLHLKQIGRSGV